MFTHPIVKCSKPLAANASAAPLDVVKMKSALGALGHYEAPEWGVSQFPDVALFDAIKAFQKSQGLKVDGMIKPDGETEAALSQAMTPRRAQTALQATAQALQSLGRGGDELLAHITPEEAALLHRVTDGASVNPQTGLLEFFWGGADRDADGNGYDNDAQHGENDASAAAASDAQSAENDQQGKDDTRDNDRDGFGDSGNGAKGGSVNGQSVDGKGLMGAAQKEDATKTQVERSTRVAGRQTGINSLTEGFLDTNTPEDEDAQDWNSSLLGEEAPAAPSTKAPTVDPNAQTDNNPAPKSNNGGGQNNSGKISAIESAKNAAENKAKDEREREAKARKDYIDKLSKSSPWDRFVLGTKFGYKNWTSVKEDDTAETRGQIDSIFGKTDISAHKDVADLNAALEAEAQKTQKENRQRMAEIDKARQRTARAAARQQELAQVRSAPQADYFSKNGVTFTDNLASNLIGGRASATATPKDGLLERTQDQKAADVGEPGMATRTSPMITDTVGPNGKNKPSDVQALQEALVRNAVMNPNLVTGYIGTATQDATKAFQEQNNLKVDGIVNLGGPTEAALMKDQYSVNLGKQSLAKLGMKSLNPITLGVGSTAMAMPGALAGPGLIEGIGSAAARVGVGAALAPGAAFLGTMLYSAPAGDVREREDEYGNIIHEDGPAGRVTITAPTGEQWSKGLNDIDFVQTRKDVVQLDNGTLMYTDNYGSRYAIDEQTGQTMVQDPDGSVWVGANNPDGSYSWVDPTGVRTSQRRQVLAEDDSLRASPPGFEATAPLHEAPKGYPQVNPDLLSPTPPSVPGDQPGPNIEGYPDLSEELNKPQIVEARKDDLEKVDYLADHHGIDRDALSTALHDLKEYYGYGGKSVHIERNTLDVSEKKGGRYIDNLENWVN